MIYVCIGLFLLLLAAIYALSRMMDQLDDLHEINEQLSLANEFYASVFHGRQHHLTQSPESAPYTDSLLPSVR